MSKRLSDTDKWTDGWFRRLPVECKILWLYMLDSCDIAGVWEVDLDLFNLISGLSVSEDVFSKHFSGRVYFFDENRKIWIRKFIDFQNGKLDENSPSKIIQVIIRLLKQHTLWIPYTMGIKVANSDVLYPIDTLKEKERVKDQVKEKEEGGVGGNIWRTFVPVVERLFGKPVSHIAEERQAKLIPELERLGATAEELEKRVIRYRECWPGVSCTLRAVISNWEAIPGLKSPKAKEHAFEVDRSQFNLKGA